MILFKLLGKCSADLIKEIRQYEKRSRMYDSENKIKAFNDKFYTNYKVNNNSLVAITDINDGVVTFVAAYDAKQVDLDAVESLIGNVTSDIEITYQEEIVLEELKRELARAYHNDWISRSEESIMKMLGLKIYPESMGFFEGPPYKIVESVYADEGLSKKQVKTQLDDILASKSFYEEIDRIYSNENAKKFVGHPVHYLINAGDKAAADDMIAILIPALLKNKRLLGGRVCDVQKLSDRAYRDENFFNIFSSAQGSTVIINLAIDSDYGDRATSYHELIEKIGKKIGEYGNDTLFIFVDISGKRNMTDDAMAAILANADMVRIDEGYGDKKRASEYLKRLARKTDYDDYDEQELINYLPDDKAEYTVSDIYNAYNKWYGNGLKSHVYKAYKEKDIVKIEVKKHDCKPYDELSKMIGLKDVKRVTDEIIAAARMRKVRKSMGLENTNNSMHMLFSGNPGSAKTTVARLIAQILKDEEVLRNGHIVECGRQDLVGKYVGWTAKAVESKFRAARGGILFIDEAYSLVEDHNSFGTEAINTIVQMMENFREEVIVIFAGYPKKMQEFLDKNEGLRSRIAFHLDFPDYDADELTDIMKLMLDKRGYKYDSEETLKKFNALCEDACGEKDFGNGRFVRNLIDHAVMRQANRLLAEHKDAVINKEEAITLKAEDFEAVNLKKERSAIGFV